MKPTVFCDNNLPVTFLRRLGQPPYNQRDNHSCGPAAALNTNALIDRLHMLDDDETVTVERVEAIITQQYDEVAKIELDQVLFTMSARYRESLKYMLEGL